MSIRHPGGPIGKVREPLVIFTAADAEAIVGSVPLQPVRPVSYEQLADELNAFADELDIDLTQERCPTPLSVLEKARSVRIAGKAMLSALGWDGHGPAAIDRDLGPMELFVAAGIDRQTRGEPQVMHAIREVAALTRWAETVEQRAAMRDKRGRAPPNEASASLHRFWRKLGELYALRWGKMPSAAMRADGDPGHFVSFLVAIDQRLRRRIEGYVPGTPAALAQRWLRADKLARGQFKGSDEVVDPLDLGDNVAMFSPREAAARDD